MAGKHSEESAKIKKLEETIALKDKEIKDIKISVADVLLKIRTINEANSYSAPEVKTRKISELCTDTRYELLIDIFDEQAENSKEIRQLLTAFEMVDASVNYTKDFSQVVINRNTKDYEVLMQWSKVFLMNKSFTTFSGSTTSRALLFPMESIYESYVAQQMKKVMGPEGWDVSYQDRGQYLFVEPRRQFALRPDIVMKKGERIVILDTKWKSLINNEKNNYGISQQDMYQMYAYSKKYGASDIWLLYPVNDEMRNHKPIQFESGDGTTVNLYFIDVDKIEDSLRELRDTLEVGGKGDFR